MYGLVKNRRMPCVTQNKIDRLIHEFRVSLFNERGRKKMLDGERLYLREDARKSDFNIRNLNF